MAINLWLSYVWSLPTFTRIRVVTRSSLFVNKYTRHTCAICRCLLLSVDCTGPANAYKINDNSWSQAKHNTKAIKSLKRQHDVHIINDVIYFSLKSEELQQGAQQVVLRRAWLCLKLLCIHPDKVCKCSGVLHFNFLHQSMKCTDLLAPRNPWANPSFSFLQLFFLFFVINLLQHSQCTEQNCIVLFMLLHLSAIAVNKHVCVCNGLQLMTSLKQLSRLDCFVTTTCVMHSYEWLVRGTRTCITSFRKIRQSDKAIAVKHYNV